MADFSPITARRREIYIPEENQAFVDAQNAPPSAYEQMKMDAVRRVYDEVLQATGSEDMARIRSRVVANRMGIGEGIWLGIVAPEAAIAGAGKAINLAKGILGGRAAAETAPVFRPNAITAEERLSLPPPRSGPAIEMPPPRQPGPPARDVRGVPDELAVMEGEGGLTADAIAAHRQSVLDRISAERAFRAKQLATMEAEGGVYPSQLRSAQNARAAENTALGERQMATLEGEGGVTADAVERARQIAQARIAAEAARREAEVARMVDEGGGMAMTRPMERGVSPPGTGFTLGETGATITPPRPMFTRMGEPSFGVPAPRGSSSPAGSGPVLEGQATRVPRSFENMYETNPYRALFLEQAGLGIPVVGGATLTAANIAHRHFMPEGRGSSPAGGSEVHPSLFFPRDGGPAAPPPAAAPAAETPAAPAAEPPAAGPAALPVARIMSRPTSASEFGRSTSQRGPSEEHPLPQRRPQAADTRAAESILSRIFSGQDYQSNSRPVVEGRKVNWGDPDRPEDFFRADKAARELGILPPIERASGGEVRREKPPKDAALVKALDIIDRLMSNR